MKEYQESYWIGRLSDFCSVSLFHAGYLGAGPETPFIFGGYNCWHIVSRGSGYVISEGKRYPLERGDLFSVMEDTKIEYGTDSDDGWEFHYLRVEGPAAKEMTAKVGFTPENPVVHPAQKEMIISRFKELLAYAKDPDQGTEFLAGQLLLLFDSLTEDHSIQRKRSSAELVAETEKILKDPFTGNVNINELASMLHVSRGKLFSAFKEVTGESPLCTLQKIRLKRICHLLKNSSLPLSDLARKTAFQNEKYLIRFFRKHMGITPGKYRKRNSLDLTKRSRQVPSDNTLPDMLKIPDDPVPGKANG